MSTLVTMQEWQTLTPADAPVLRGLSLDGRPAARRLATELAKRTMLDVTELHQGLAIATNSFVGNITLGDVQIIVRPKVPANILRVLLHYAYGLRNLETFAGTAQAVERGTFQDLIIAQLAAEAEALLARGLPRAYAAVHEELASPRGRIDVQAIARQGGIRGASAPCTHYPRVLDTLPNRILAAGLELAATLTADVDLRGRVRRLRALLADEVAAVALRPDVLAGARQALTRLTNVYAPIYDLIELLLGGSGASDQQTQRDLHLPGFLFDMNRFFEALITRFLAQNLVSATLHSQYSLRGMMRYAAGRNPRGHKPPTPRPDLVVTQNGKIIAMLDTKYRDLWTHQLPREMLYQLTIYAFSRKDNREATILYPTVDAVTQDQVIEVVDPVYGGQRARVVLRAINLDELSNVIGMTGAAGERQRELLARRLVLGAGV